MMVGPWPRREGGCPTLYRRVLGPGFERLPAVLRRFHDAERGGSARGILTVMRGDGWVRGLVADLLRLPPAGEGVRMELRVTPDGGRERWTRRFDGRRLETVQWLERGLLVEAVGPCRFGFRVRAGREGLTFESVRGRLFGLPLPRAAALRVEASAIGRARSWDVDVRIAAPVLGLLVRYRGEVTPT